MRYLTAFLLLMSLTSSQSVAADPAAAAPAKRPNILLAVADDWSFGHAGAYGCQWVKTPAFDRIAREGLLFTRAFTPNAKCAPSRAAVLTGRNSWQLKEAANHMCYFPPEFKVYPEVLAEHGYHVGSTAKGWAPGVAVTASGEPRELAGKPWNDHHREPPTPHISNNDYARNFEAFVDAAPEGKPWCFWYGSLEPHRAYEYGSGARLAGKKPDDIDRVPGFWPDNETVRNDMLDYAYETEHFDTHLGGMIALLEERGELDNTLIIVTSDNGMPFPRAKGQGYEFSNHLPLAIRWPAGIPHPGRQVDAYVSFIDFAPTLIEVAGLSWEETGMAPASGRSLLDLLGAAPDQAFPERDHVLIGKERHDVGRPDDQGYPIRGLIKNDLLFLTNYEIDRWPVGNPETGYLNCDGSPTKTEILKLRQDSEKKRFWDLSFGKRPREEFYNLAVDPDCLVNLAEDPAHRATTDQMRAQMIAELTAQEDPRMRGEGAVFDHYRVANEQNRDFYNRYKAGEIGVPGWVNATDFENWPED
ncbi:MAG: sulfatase [Opitutaceae bacterium]